MAEDLAGQTQGVINSLGFVRSEVKFQKVVITVVEAFDSVGEALFAPILAQSNGTALVGNELINLGLNWIEFVFAVLVGDEVQQLIMDFAVLWCVFFHSL